MKILMMFPRNRLTQIQIKQLFGHQVRWQDEQAFSWAEVVFCLDTDISKVLSKRKPEAHVVALTADVDWKKVRRAFAGGACDALPLAEDLSEAIVSCSRCGHMKRT